jgi:hypothetical protein
LVERLFNNHHSKFSIILNGEIYKMTKVLRVSPLELFYIEEALGLYLDSYVARPHRSTPATVEERRETIADLNDLRERVAIAKLPGRTRRTTNQDTK